MTPVRRAAVLGSPVSHSLSPVLHRAAYTALGLHGWVYDAHDVTEDVLPGFLAGLGPEWAGVSLTMPLKAAVLPLLDETSPLAARVGAANTVLFQDGRRVGENTDVPGMVAALREAGVESVPAAAVLGGGATARSAVAALAGLAGTVTAFVRSPARLEGLRSAAGADRSDIVVAGWEQAADALAAPLVVNTTPAGGADPLADLVPARPGVLFEVLYDPWPTPLAAAWLDRGGLVVDGLALLVHQAVLQVHLMTGASVAPERLLPILRAAGETALGAR